MGGTRREKRTVAGTMTYPPTANDSSWSRRRPTITQTRLRFKLCSIGRKTCSGSFQHGDDGLRAWRRIAVVVDPANRRRDPVGLDASNDRQALLDPQPILAQPCAPFERIGLREGAD